MISAAFKPAVGGSASTSVSYFFTDHLGGTNVVTNASGSVVQVLDYYPFGSVRVNSKTGETDERRKFTGHEYDESTGLTYANARYLDTNIGKFMSQDPAFLLIGSPQFEERYNRSLREFLFDPQLLNSYSYARNNPLNFVDRDGENPALAALIVGLINLTNALINYVNALGGPGMAAIQINQAVQTFKSPDSTPLQKGVEGLGLLPFGSFADDVGKQGSRAAKEILPDSAYFCRGGRCNIEDWMKGGPLRDGKLTDISVQSTPGMSPEELLQNTPTKSGRSYPQGGAARVGDVRRLGGDVISTPKPGNPYHATLMGITPQQATDLVQKVINPHHQQKY
jgi:RHS repeat-associated protein